MRRTIIYIIRLSTPRAVMYYIAQLFVSSKFSKVTIFHNDRAPLSKIITTTKITPTYTFPPEVTILTSYE